MIKNYLEYIRDNPQGYWFKAKLYGWGWTPARWQGWATIFIFLALVLLNLYRLDSRFRSTGGTLLNFIPETFILILILIHICYKTGEKPSWHWGTKNKQIK
ncbi:MAG: hypothetical protein NT034_02450 [Candidatus Magasanikbacteria bacterium]|nr:hypothetical protein [Candidatus Magasanikbacteria bacterium]